MALKTACCGCKLRTGSLVLLYLYLIGSVYVFLTNVSKYSNPQYREVLADSIIYPLSLLFYAVGSVVFLIGIISIHRGKTFGLSAVVVFLVVSSVYAIIELIRYQVNDDEVRKIYNIEVKNALQKLRTEEEKRQAQKIFDVTYSTTMVVLNVTTILSILLNVYTIFVIRAHKKELEEEASAPGGYQYQPPNQLNKQLAV